MKIIRRHYKSVSKHYRFNTWRSGNYRAFDLYWGNHLFVLGFEMGKKK